MKIDCATHIQVLLLATSGLMARAQLPNQELSQARELLALANHARAVGGLGELAWDETLAAAAQMHCRRMAAEGPLAHRYDGEPDLTARAGAAGAHFSAIEENIAVGSDPATIQQGWLDSPEHRANLFSPSIDHVGIAVVKEGQLIFVVADYARAVPALSQAEVETQFGALLRARGLMVLRDATDARTYCQSNERYHGGDPPSFLFRWQDPDVKHLPDPVLEQLAVGRYHRAAVGSCTPRGVNGAFTIYRVAVLLY
jgi:cysteine-rich secretory family protein